MQTDTYTIRPAAPADAKALLSIYAPYVQHTAITFEYQVPSLEEFTDRIKKTLELYPYLTAEYQGELLGYAYAGPFHTRPAYNWSAETSIYVNTAHRQQGVGKALYDALENILKKQGITNLYACIACPEKEDPYLSWDSIYFHQHLGYEIAGKFHNCGYKFNRWYHMVWMEKCIGDHQSIQPPVKPFSLITAP